MPENYKMDKTVKAIVVILYLGLLLGVGVDIATNNYPEAFLLATYGVGTAFCLRRESNRARAAAAVEPPAEPTAHIEDAATVSVSANHENDVKAAAEHAAAADAPAEHAPDEHTAAADDAPAEHAPDEHTAAADDAPAEHAPDEHTAAAVWSTATTTAHIENAATVAMSNNLKIASIVFLVLAVLAAIAAVVITIYFPPSAILFGLGWNTIAGVAAGVCGLTFGGLFAADRYIEYGPTDKLGLRIGRDSVGEEIARQTSNSQGELPISSSNLDHQIKQELGESNEKAQGPKSADKTGRSNSMGQESSTRVSIQERSSTRS